MSFSRSQAILPFLPGYMFDGSTLKTTGAALPPTQHIHPETGEVIYYVRPIFECGPTVGMFIRYQGIIDWLKTQGKV
jgi:hypothetical protein